MATSVAKKRKSGLITLKAGEILFHENDHAKSLYIIQKGQLRLYKPKGRGFIELAVLRAGEVIGEMAYFDEGSNKRSCSAAAIVDTQIIEVTFNAFSKAMSGLNPWFKTIVDTLAGRLRKTNDKVKSLESNSVGFGAGGKVADYKFFHMIDIVKILSMYYLVFKSHGEEKDGKYSIHISKLQFYAIEIFNIMEVKFEEFYNILLDEKMITLEMDKDNLPKVLVTRNIAKFRELFVFFNQERVTDDKKRLNVSSKCERILSKMLIQVQKRGLNTGKVDQAGRMPKVEIDLTAIFDDFRARKVPIFEEDLADAVTMGISEDILVGDGNKLTAMVNYQRLEKLYPCIHLTNIIKKVNEKKTGASY